MRNRLDVVKDLSQIFPDIEGELCSRHSILFGKLKNTFNKMYDGLEPAHFIVVKGLLDIFRTEDTSLSMALENGVILMLRKTDANAQIFINSNHFDEQLILSSAGKQEEGLSPHVEEIRTAIQAANKGVASERLSGAIIYLHSNIPEDSFYYRQIMFISFFIGMALINGNLSQFSVDELIERMAATKVMGDSIFLEKLFSYKNRKFDLCVGDTQYLVDFEPKYKLVLCQLDLAKQDVEFERFRKRLLAAKRSQILQQCKQQSGLDSVLKIFACENQLQFNYGGQPQKQLEDQILQPQKFMSIALKEYGLLSEFSNGNITFEQLISAQWQINSKYWGLHSDQVVELVEGIKENLKLNSVMIINESFALIVAEKTKYTDLLIYLRQKLHKGELKSKSLFKIEEQLVQHRWSSDKNIGQKMFTSVPSYGVSVFDPSEAIWF